MRTRTRIVILVLSLSFIAAGVAAKRVFEAHEWLIYFHTVGGVLLATCFLWPKAKVDTTNNVKTNTRRSL